MNVIPTSKHWKSAAKLMLGLGLLLLLILSIEPRQLASTIDTANLSLAILAFVLFSTQGIFESMRLKIVFADYGVGIREGIKLFFFGLFFSNFMLGTAGADMYQVYHMNNKKLGLIRPLSLSIFLRLNGLISNIALGIIAIYLSKNYWGDFIDIQITLPGWLKFSPLLAVIVLLVSSVSSRIREYLRSTISQTIQVLRDFLRVATAFSLLHLSLISLLGIFVILARAIGLYVLVKAFGASVSYIDIMVVVTITTAVTSLPISFAGLGIRELSATAALIGFGISPTAAVAAAVVSRFFIWLLSLVGGLWFLFERRRAEPIDAIQNICSGKKYVLPSKVLTKDTTISD